MGQPSSRSLIQSLQWLCLAMGSVLPVHAQITDPNQLVAPPPRPPALRQHSGSANRTGSGNLQWLWQYAQPAPNGNAVNLRNDERFASLLADSFRQPQAMWGHEVPISAIIPRFLAGYGAVNSRENRFLTVDGCVPSFCAAHGMLWADLGQPDPLMIFAAVDWTTEAHTTDEAAADYNLWLFPNHALSPDAVPLQLTRAMAAWDARLATAHRGVPHVAHAVLVEPDGHPFPLNPSLVGANTLPPQPDTATPHPADAP